MKKKFLGWDSGIVCAAIGELEKETCGFPPDLSRICIVTQTAQSGRRLKYELAKKFAGGFFPPLFVTTEFFLRNAVQNAKLPSPLDEKFIWMESFRAAPDDLMKKLKLRKDRNMEILSATASRFCEIRRQLAENCFTIASFAEKASQMNLEEAERWRGFAELEKIYLAELNKRGYEDTELWKINSEPDFEKLKGIEKIILLGLCDPVPAAMSKIAKIAKKIETEIWIHAPEELADSFDEWGRPISELWGQFKINIDAEQVSLAQDYGKTARLAARKFAEKIRRKESCAIALLNPDMLPYLEKEFSKIGAGVCNPAGIPFPESQIFNLLDSFADLLSEKTFDAFANFARCGAFLKYMKNMKKDKFRADSFLSDLDEFRDKSLPQRFDDVKIRSESENVKFAAEECENLMNLFHKKKLGDALPELLIKILNDGTDIARMSETAKMDPDEFGEELRKSLAELKNSQLESSALPPADKLKFFIENLKEKKIRELSAENSVPLSGWLEMQFETAENIILCGMNEGCLPEAPSNDIFMPDSAREKLGLRCASSRFARDAYILKAIMQSRKKENLSFILSKTALRNEPLLPSRLLFLNDDNNMVAKIAEKVFSDNGEALPEEPALPSIIWKLKAPRVILPDKLSITDFKNYMICPFRFYLAKVLNMKKLDFLKVEMDPLDFGNIIHETLKKFAENKKLAGTTNSSEISDFLIRAAEALTGQRFGNEPTVTLFLQTENMKSRLEKFAKIQAEENAKGWRIYLSELPIEAKIAGMTLRGRIDRIDVSEDGNTARIIDYKTSDHSESPEKAHIIKYNSGKVAEYRRINGGDRAWADLQLPLYAIMLQEKEEFRDKKIICAYANLPKALADCKIEEWEISPEILASAKKCAEEIVKRISSFEFWPPAEKVAHDDFSEIFLGNPIESVDPQILLSKTDQ